MLRYSDGVRKLCVISVYERSLKVYVKDFDGKEIYDSNCAFSVSP